MAEWQVVLGMGDHFIGSVNKEVGAWNQYKDQMGSLEANAEFWENTAHKLAANIAGNALVSPDGIESCIDAATEDCTSDTIAAARADAYAEALHRLNQMRNGANYGSLESRWARLTVLEPGVHVTERKIGMISNRTLVGEPQELAPGREFVGNKLEINGSPEQGGLLRMASSWRRTLEITGLVDVEREKPRVRLDILRRAR